MVAEWDIVFSFQFSLLHLVIGLLDGIPTVLYAKLLHCVTGKLLDVEAVYDAVGFGKCRTNNFPHGIGQIKGDFFDCKAFFLVNPPQCINHILRLRARHDGDQGFLSGTCVPVGHKRIQFPVGQ